MRIIRQLTFVLLDIFLLTLAMYLAIATKFGVQLTRYYLSEWFIIWSCLISIGIICNACFSLYRSMAVCQHSGIVVYSIFQGLPASPFCCYKLLNIQVAYSVYFLIVVYNTIFLG